MGSAAAEGLIAVALVAGTGAGAPLDLTGPRVVARGGRMVLTGQGAPARQRVRIERRLRTRWVLVASPLADRRGRFKARYRPRRLRRVYLLRARTRDGAVSPILRVRSRDLTLAAVGDINLGDGPLRVMRQRGFRFPWTGVAPVLRRADIAFGNLECPVSRRGRPVVKKFTFRGPPRALGPVARYAGFDVLNLANNHTGDYGRTALLDTVRYVRSFGMKAVGAGGSIGAAGKPRIVRRLGLRVGFVGFSNLLPASFYAGPRRAGTQPASVPEITRNVRRARRRADVVIATFHWGDELAPRPTGRQRAFAIAALRAGASAVIGAHPHVLQPIRRHRRRLVAYSLGNFVFPGNSPATARTGILKLKLSARGVEASRLLPARIENTRPRLLGRW